MKPIAIVLVNVATVAVGLTVYHFATAPGPRGPDAAGPGTTALEAELEDVVARLDDLERRRNDRREAQRTAELLDRLTALEARLDGLPAGRATGAADDDARVAGELAAAGLAGDGPAGSTEADLERVRELVEKVDEQRRREREMGMVDALLERLEIRLTDKQKEQLLVELQAARETARGRIREAFQSGASREEAFASMGEVRAELGEKLATFLPASDAEAIAAGTWMGPGGPGGPGFGGGGNRGGGGR